MRDRRTIRVFMNDMVCMGLLLVATGLGTVWVQRTFYDPSEDAAFEVQMRKHDAFLAEHERRMEEHARAMEALTPALREEKSPCP